MHGQRLPQGRFTYGPTAAVVLDVIYVEAPQPQLVPVRDPFDRAFGRPDVLRLPAAFVTKLADRAGVTPLEAAHFTIGYHAAKLAVGQAMPAYNAPLLDTPTLWEQVNGDISEQEFAARRARRDLFAIEMAGSLARRHPHPVERFGLERIRYTLLTAAGFEMDSPFQRDYHSKLAGAPGETLWLIVRDRILPWFRANIAS